MEFETESGSTYRLRPAFSEGFNPLYRVERIDKDGNESEFTAEIATRIPIEIGARVIFTVFEGEHPTMLMTTRVQRRGELSHRNAS